MREATFDRPSVRKIIEINGHSAPRKIDERAMWKMTAEGWLLPVGDKYQQGVETLEYISDKPRYIALFTTRFGVTKEQFDQGLKSLDWLVKLDSQRVLEQIAGKGKAPERLTKEFLEEYRIKPENLSSLAFNDIDVENPKVGAYWVGTDGHVHAWTFYRATVASEMEAMQDVGDFPKAIIEDKTTYGKNVRLKVPSRSVKDKWYEMTLTRLPMAKKGTPQEFSGWLNVAHNSNDPDAVYLGSEHDKRVLPVYFWSASAIYGFYESMLFAEKLGNYKFRANPFPISANPESTNFIDNLRLRSLILEKDKKTGEFALDVLNKTEMDLIIGAKTALRGYNNCWYHWGKHKTDYLYTKPKT